MGRSPSPVIRYAGSAFPRPDSKSVRHRPVGRGAQKPVPDTNRQPVVPLPAIDAFPVAAQGHRAHLLERFRSGRPDRGNPIGRLLRRHRGRSRKRGHLHSGGKASVTRVRNPADDNPATGAPSCSGIAPGNGSPPASPSRTAGPPSTASASSPSTPTHFASLSPVGQNDRRQRQDSPPARWAIKTNLLYWAALAPNLEAELGLGHRWSVGLEALCAWWSNERAHRYYQLFAAGPEVRFRFAGPGRFHGHYVGLYGSAGFYDLENRKTGYQGDFWSAGITYGYQLPVGRSFGVEFAVGAGMIGSSYKTYEPRDGLYVYQQTKRIRYTGLTKARISLLWRFGGKGGRL
ncbi:MAG: DUF3575 domain-containing protein [Alistipes sp.]|nr:DUF3575 domain-containing protein [Alistipes sp.]